ncbi:MAG: hypothetical protein EBU20_09325 [Betaproteobacteria bacterium]|jgi:hypothetical protein|nr:hypothetical protein [Betaproteobacteria bacterium]
MVHSCRQATQRKGCVALDDVNGHTFGNKRAEIFQITQVENAAAARCHIGFAQFIALNLEGA